AAPAQAGPDGRRYDPPPARLRGESSGLRHGEFAHKGRWKDLPPALSWPQDLHEMTSRSYPRPLHPAELLWQANNRKASPEKRVWDCGRIQEYPIGRCADVQEAATANAARL